MNCAKLFAAWIPAAIRTGSKSKNLIAILKKNRPTWKTMI
jgi:hypothetical protein